MQIQNVKTLVTGATSGLGLSIAQALLNKGAFVYILGRSKSNLSSIESDLPTKNYQLLLADVSNFTQLENSLKDLQIDVLINNAGVWLEGELQTNSVSDIDNCLDINLKGLIYATKIVLPQMLKRNSGSILNISSTSGLSGKISQSVYCASKFGVRGFTDSLKLDLAKTNIKVMGFYPGGMNTPIFSKVGSSRIVNNWMDPHQVAETIIFMLEHDENMLIANMELNRRSP